jgi:SAM-dependent methyltransferase
LQNTNIDTCQQLNVGCLARVSTDLEPNADIVATPESLPFGESTIDLILLPHTLDYCENPVTALREASQVLNAEGIVVLTGFNPLSLFGLGRKLSIKKRAPYTARFIPLKVVQDWLALLGFTLLGVSMLEYRPLIRNQKMRDKLSFLNKTGERWWPIAGGVYVLVAKKQIYSKINVKRQSSLGRDWLKILTPISADINKS